MVGVGDGNVDGHSDLGVGKSFSEDPHLEPGSCLESDGIDKETKWRCISDQLMPKRTHSSSSQWNPSSNAGRSQSIPADDVALCMWRKDPESDRWIFFSSI
jgi:hypothetical protein